MAMVFPISMKSYRCALAASFVFPLYWIACTTLMRLGLSSDSRFSVLSTRPVWMFSTVGGDNSNKVFSAIASGTGYELPS